MDQNRTQQIEVEAQAETIERLSRLLRAETATCDHNAAAHEAELQALRKAKDEQIRELQALLSRQNDMIEDQAETINGLETVLARYRASDALACREVQESMLQQAAAQARIWQAEAEIERLRELQSQIRASEPAMAVRCLTVGCDQIVDTTQPHCTFAGRPLCDRCGL